ncbi:zinc finger protein Xfin [Larimichthys crocea]|uniref:zinc finger protein Xfin n=1 Tax=Larimichthys crocea TaxID=215358 RepID=UPI000622E410|nr:zinc finger protein Xfin [Larimichthys crocea]
MFPTDVRPSSGCGAEFPSERLDLPDWFRRRLLTAAREDLVGHLEAALCGHVEEVRRRQKLLDALLQPEIKLRRADVQQLKAGQEEVPPSLGQEGPTEPVHIKEEQEEEWSSTEQLQGLSEVKEEDEEKPGNHGEDCGGAEPDRTSDPDCCSGTDDSDDADWTGGGRSSLRCAVCLKMFAHRGNLNKHMRTHTGVKPFGCSLCGKRFIQKAGLDYHVKIHTGERPFSCSLCGKTYRHKGALTYHMTTHTGAKPFGCNVCGKRFRGTSQLQVHACVRPLSRSTLSCSECDATFPNNYRLMTHARMHRGKKLFTCTICGKKRQFSSHLEIHMRTHTGEKPYSCSVCGKRFSQRGILTQHTAVHSEVKPFECPVCGRRFFWQFQIKKHKCLGESMQQRLMSFNGSEPAENLKPGVGEETELSFVTDDVDFWRETRQHRSRFTYQRNKKVCVKTGEKPSSCSSDTTKTEPRSADSINIDLCRQTRQCLSAVNYLQHEEVSDRKLLSSPGDRHTLQMLTKCPAGQRALSCLFCGKGFTSGGSLTRHLCVHVGEKLLSCIVCDKTFSSESELMNHECVGDVLQRHHKQTERKGVGRKHHIRVHAAEKPLSCSLCGETFIRPDALSDHMTSHTGEKTFSCSVCNSGFTDSESLIKHMRIHTRQTQFSCSVCGKEFAWRRSLTKHMEVHARRKPLSCPVCGKQFPWRRDLTKHMVIHAKARMYRCTACHRRFAHFYQLNYHQCAGPEPQLHPSQEDREAEPLIADGDNCGGPEPAGNPDHRLTADTDGEPETDDSDDDWTESRPQPGLNSTDTGQNHQHCLKIQTRNHTGDVPEPGSLTQHRVVHEPAEPPHVKEEPAEPPHIKEEPAEPPHIKEEPDEVRISQEEVTSPPVPVKTEDDDDEEEKPQSSQLHQMETEADGEDCGGPEPDRTSDPELDRTSDPDTDDSVDSDFWKETRQRPSGLKSVTEDESVSNTLSCSDEASDGEDDEDGEEGEDGDFWKDDRKPEDTSRKPHSCSECGKRFVHVHHMKNHMKSHGGKRAAFFCSVCGQECLYRSHLKIHMRTHTGEKPFVCPVCGKKYAHKASMQSHMSVHTVDKQYSCSACDRSFAWYTELKYHECDGESSRPRHRDAV